MKRKFKEGDTLIVVHEIGTPELVVGDRVTCKGYCDGCDRVLLNEFPYHIDESCFEVFKKSACAPEESEDKKPETISEEDVMRVFRKLSMMPMYYSRNGLIPVAAFQDLVIECVDDLSLREKLFQYIKK